MKYLPDPSWSVRPCDRHFAWSVYATCRTDYVANLMGHAINARNAERVNPLADVEITIDPEIRAEMLQHSHVPSKFHNDYLNDTTFEFIEKKSGGRIAKVFASKKIVKKPRKTLKIRAWPKIEIETEPDKE